jgi:ATP:corrinoid adenosyltransferase
MEREMELRGDHGVDTAHLDERALWELIDHRSCSPPPLETRKVKHTYDAGIGARKGIEY